MRNRWLAAVAGLMATSVAGCVSVPSSGPVRPFAITQDAGGTGQQYPQIFTRPPQPGWSPEQIVQGFLAASGSFADNHEVAKEYLTPGASKAWKPSWSAIVFGDGPNVTPATVGNTKSLASVTVSGSIQAKLLGEGGYALASTTSTTEYSQPFSLSKTNGQWRISAPPPAQLLLTDVDFAADYELRNLYFFNPAGNLLVPDPVYAPLYATATDLASGLVNELIRQPDDWLAGGATTTAFPAGTKLLGRVSLNGGTAAVNLGGAAARASPAVLNQISAQLTWTLAGSGEGQPLVQSVELYVNGKAWTPHGNPVQQLSSFSGLIQSSSGAAAYYYICAERGLQGVCSRQPPTTQSSAFYPTGTVALSTIAVSPDGRNLAGLDNGQVYVGQLHGGSLIRARGLSGSYTSLSWDADDDLWVAGSNGVFIVHADGGNPIPVAIVNSDNTPVQTTVTALRVAPDGVRVALVAQGPGQDSPGLGFGSVIMASQSRAGVQPQATIRLSPFSVTDHGFTGVTWYDDDDVVALSSQQPALQEYPVNGSAPTQIQNEPDMQFITASGGGDLVAGLAGGVIAYDAGITGSWVVQQGQGSSPAYPG